MKGAFGFSDSELSELDRSINERIDLIRNARRQDAVIKDYSTELTARNFRKEKVN